MTDHGGHPADHHVRTHVDVVANPDMTAQEHAVTQPDTASHGDKSADQAIFSDVNIVRDVNQVVDFGTVADNRPGNRAAVNRAVRPDFHIVPDNDSARWVRQDQEEQHARSLSHPGSNSATALRMRIRQNR